MPTCKAVTNKFILYNVMSKQLTIYSIFISISFIILSLYVQCTIINYNMTKFMRFSKAD